MEPSEAGPFGRGGARERTEFSPPGGNGGERTLRRRWPLFLWHSKTVSFSAREKEMGFGKAPGRRRQIKKYLLNLCPAYAYLLLPPAGHFRLAESGQRPVGKGGFRPSPLPDTLPPSNGQTQGGLRSPLLEVPPGLSYCRVCQHRRLTPSRRRCWGADGTSKQEALSGDLTKGPGERPLHLHTFPQSFPHRCTDYPIEKEFCTMAPIKPRTLSGFMELLAPTA